MCLLTLTIAFVVALTPLAISAVRATDTARTRWAPARVEARTLLADFVDQETAERGYVITENPTYLEPFATGRADTPRRLAALERELPAPDRPLVESVRDAYARWLGITRREMSALAEHDPARARRVVKIGVGRQRFDELRSREDRLAAAVDARLDDALRTAQRANRGFVAALIAALVLGVFAVAVSWRLLRRNPTEAQSVSDLERLQRDDRRRFIETLQSALLPTIDDHDLPLVLATRYLPANTSFEIGGDWHDVFRLAGGRVGIVVGDVVGRGIRAAAAMSQVRGALHAIALRGDDPAEVFDRLDEFAATYPDALCTTAFYAIYDPAKGTLAYSNAGHPPPLVVDGDGLHYLGAARRPPVGGASDDSRSTPREYNSTGVPGWSCTPTVSSSAGVRASTSDWHDFRASPPASTTHRSTSLPTPSSAR